MIQAPYEIRLAKLRLLVRDGGRAREGPLGWPITMNLQNRKWCWSECCRGASILSDPTTLFPGGVGTHYFFWVQSFVVQWLPPNFCAQGNCCIIRFEEPPDFQRRRHCGS